MNVSRTKQETCQRPFVNGRFSNSMQQEKEIIIIVSSSSSGGE
jgi:hypothetical protein